MSDSVKFKHHAIKTPELTPSDRILEAARDLNDAIRQQPKQAPLEEREAIELLREVMLGERKEQIPPNGIQTRKSMEHQMPVQTPQQVPEAEDKSDTPPEAKALEFAKSTAPPGKTRPPQKCKKRPMQITQEDDQESDAEHWNCEGNIPGDGLRRSKRVKDQIKQNNLEGLHHIVALAATESAEIPDLKLNSPDNKNNYKAANHYLQMNEWALEKYFAGAIICEKTGEAL